MGERTELARYRVSAGERVLYGQRINGCVRITDCPASAGGRSFLVERELEHDGYSALKALVVDYAEQARRLDEVPMASSVVRRQLEQLTATANHAHRRRPPRAGPSRCSHAARAGSGATARIRRTRPRRRPVSTITAPPTPVLDPAPGALRTPRRPHASAATPSSDTGAIREIVRLPIADGSALVVDRSPAPTATRACSLAWQPMSLARTRRSSAPCISRTRARAAAAL